MRILTRIFAFIGFMVVLSISLSVAAGVWYANKEPKLPTNVVLEFDFSRNISEVGNADPLSEILGSKAVDLRTVILALDRARRDDRVKGLVANVGDTSLTPAQIEEVRTALKRFTDSGKFAYAYAPSFGELGPGNRTYWLASAFTNIRLQPLGLVGLTGAAMSQPFARTALDTIGVVPDVHQRHEYKGAAANMVDAALPEPLRQNYQTLLDDLHNNMLRDIAASRNIKDTELRALIDKAPLLGQTALEGKLIDAIGYEDEMRKDALTAAGKGAEFYDLISFLQHSPPRALADARSIALIYASGPIVGSNNDRGPMGERAVAGAKELQQALADAVKAPGIDVIVVRMDSPGGSVTASETVYHAIKQARAAGKYVIISMGSTAASGGYWISSAADYILAQPSTLTGSIGVVAGKLVIGPISERLGINWSTLTTGANSGMWAPNQAFSGDALVRVEASLDEIYNGFTQRVAEGRKLTAEQVDALARGRVWSGSHAKELGLVDELGGLREAFNAALKHMGVDENAAIRLAVFPKPETPSERVLKLLQQFAATPSLNPLSWSDMGPALAALLHLPGTQANGALYYSGPAGVE